MAKKVKANGMVFTFPDSATNKEIGDALDEYFAKTATSEVSGDKEPEKKKPQNIYSGVGSQDFEISSRGGSKDFANNGAGVSPNPIVASLETLQKTKPKQPVKKETTQVAEAGVEPISEDQEIVSTSVRVDDRDAMEKKIDAISQSGFYESQEQQYKTDYTLQQRRDFNPNRAGNYDLAQIEEASKSGDDGARFAAKNELDKYYDDLVRDQIDFLWNIGDQSKANQLKETFDELKSEAISGDLSRGQSERLRDIYTNAQMFKNEELELKRNELDKSYNIKDYYKSNANVLRQLEDVNKSIAMNGETMELMSKRDALIGMLQNDANDKGITNALAEYDAITSDIIHPMTTYGQKTNMSLGITEAEEAEALKVRQGIYKKVDANNTITGLAEKGVTMGYDATSNFFNTFVGGFMSAVGQSPKVIGDVFGDEDYDWADELYDKTSGLKEYFSNALNTELEDEPTYLYLPRVFGAAAGSMATMYTGGALGKMVKATEKAHNIGRYTSTMLMQLSDNYEEAMNEGMTQQDAAMFGTWASALSAAVEMIVPEGAPALKAEKLRDAIKRGVKGKELMDISRNTAKEYFLNATKELGEEEFELVVSDLNKALFGYDQDNLFSAKEIKDSALGAVMLSGAMTAFRGGRKQPKMIADALFDIAEITEDNLPSMSKEDIKRQKQLHEIRVSLEAVPSFGAMDRDDRVIAFDLARQKMDLENAAKVLGNEELSAQAEKVGVELNEMLSSAEQGDLNTEEVVEAQDEAKKEEVPQAEVESLPLEPTKDVSEAVETPQSDVAEVVEGFPAPTIEMEQSEVAGEDQLATNDVEQTQIDIEDGKGNTEQGLGDVEGGEVPQVDVDGNNGEGGVKPNETSEVGSGTDTSRQVREVDEEIGHLLFGGTNDGGGSDVGQGVLDGDTRGEDVLESEGKDDNIRDAEPNIVGDDVQGNRENTKSFAQLEKARRKLEDRVNSFLGNIRAFNGLRKMVKQSSYGAKLRKSIEKEAKKLGLDINHTRSGMRAMKGGKVIRERGYKKMVNERNALVKRARERVDDNTASMDLILLLEMARGLAVTPAFFGQLTALDPDSSEWKAAKRAGRIKDDGLEDPHIFIERMEAANDGQFSDDQVQEKLGDLLKGASDGSYSRKSFLNDVAEMMRSSDEKELKPEDNQRLESEAFDMYESVQDSVPMDAIDRDNVVRAKIKEIVGGRADESERSFLLKELNDKLDNEITNRSKEYAPYDEDEDEYKEDEDKDDDMGYHDTSGEIPFQETNDARVEVLNIFSDIYESDGIVAAVRAAKEYADGKAPEVRSALLDFIKDNAEALRSGATLVMDFEVTNSKEFKEAVRELVPSVSESDLEGLAVVGEAMVKYVMKLDPSMSSKDAWKAVQGFMTNDINRIVNKLKQDGDEQLQYGLSRLTEAEEKGRGISGSVNAVASAIAHGDSRSKGKDGRSNTQSQGEAITGLLRQNNIEGKIFTPQESEEYQKEVESNYDVGGISHYNDIRQRMWSYEHPYIRTNINGVDIRLAHGMHEKDPKSGLNRITHIIYADGKIAGKFYNAEDAKKVLNILQASSDYIAGQSKKLDRAKEDSILMQGAKGATSIEEGITAYTSGADLSTLIHEPAHNFLGLLEYMAANGNKEAQKRIDAISDFAKSNEGKKFWDRSKRAGESWAQGEYNENDWTFRQELFARSAEKYFMEGARAGFSAKMNAVFESFATFMWELYKGVKNSPEYIELSDEMRSLFDALYGKEAVEKIKDAKQDRKYRNVIEAYLESNLSEDQKKRLRKDLRNFKDVVSFADSEKMVDEMIASDGIDRVLQDAMRENSSIPFELKSIVFGRGLVSLRDRISKASGEEKADLQAIYDEVYYVLASTAWSAGFFNAYIAKIYRSDPRAMAKSIVKRFKRLRDNPNMGDAKTAAKDIEAILNSDEKMSELFDGDDFSIMDVIDVVKGLEKKVKSIAQRKITIVGRTKTKVQGNKLGLPKDGQKPSNTELRKRAAEAAKMAKAALAKVGKPLKQEGTNVLFQPNTPNVEFVMGASTWGKNVMAENPMDFVAFANLYKSIFGNDGMDYVMDVYEASKRELTKDGYDISGLTPSFDVEALYDLMMEEAEALKSLEKSKEIADIRESFASEATKSKVNIAKLKSIAANYTALTGDSSFETIVDKMDADMKAAKTNKAKDAKAKEYKSLVAAASLKRRNDINNALRESLIKAGFSRILPNGDVAVDWKAVVTDAKDTKETTKKIMEAAKEHLDPAMYNSIESALEYTITERINEKKEAKILEFINRRKTQLSRVQRLGRAFTKPTRVSRLMDLYRMGGLEYKEIFTEIASLYNIKIVDTLYEDFVYNWAERMALAEKQGSDIQKAKLEEEMQAFQSYYENGWFSPDKFLSERVNAMLASMNTTLQNATSIIETAIINPILEVAVAQVSKKGVGDKEVVKVARKTYVKAVFTALDVLMGSVDPLTAHSYKTSNRESVPSVRYFEKTRHDLGIRNGLSYIDKQRQKVIRVFPRLMSAFDAFGHVMTQDMKMYNILKASYLEKGYSNSDAASMAWETMNYDGLRDARAQAENEMPNATATEKERRAYEILEDGVFGVVGEEGFVHAQEAAGIANYKLTEFGVISAIGKLLDMVSKGATNAISSLDKKTDNENVKKLVKALDVVAGGFLRSMTLFLKPTFNVIEQQLKYAAFASSVTTFYAAARIVGMYTYSAYKGGGAMKGDFQRTFKDMAKGVLGFIVASALGWEDEEDEELKGIGPVNKYENQNERTTEQYRTWNGVSLKWIGHMELYGLMLGAIKDSKRYKEKGLTATQVAKMLTIGGYAEALDRTMYEMGDEKMSSSITKWGLNRFGMIVNPLSRTFNDVAMMIDYKKQANTEYDYLLKSLGFTAAIDGYAFDAYGNKYFEGQVNKYSIDGFLNHLDNSVEKNKDITEYRRKYNVGMAGLVDRGYIEFFDKDMNIIQDETMRYKVSEEAAKYRGESFRGYITKYPKGRYSQVDGVELSELDYRDLKEMDKVNNIALAQVLPNGGNKLVIVELTETRKKQAAKDAKARGTTYEAQLPISTLEGLVKEDFSDLNSAANMVARYNYAKANGINLDLQPKWKDVDEKMNLLLLYGVKMD